MRTTHSLPFCEGTTRAWAVLLGLWTVLVLMTPAQGQVIMFDFGPTTVGPAYVTYSPGHASGAIPSGMTSWNMIGVTDVTTGLIYADGSSAGLGILTGVESTSSSNTIDFTLDPNNGSGLTGTALTGGIYEGTSPARDGIFHSSGSEPWAIGLQITGLAAGTYDIYLSGRNTNFGGSYPQNFYAAASSPGSSFDFGSLSASSATNSGSSSNPPTTWVEGDTYVLFTVSLTEGQVLNIATQGTGIDNAGRGFLNSLQIVTVPEPSVTGLLAGGAGALLFWARRKRRAA